MPKFTDKELGLSDNPMIKDSDPLASDKGEEYERTRNLVAKAREKRLAELVTALRRIRSLDEKNMGQAREIADEALRDR